MNRLLSYDAQKDYYNKIVERYMRFCANNSRDLDTAWTSLVTSASADPTRNPPTARWERPPSAARESSISGSSVTNSNTLSPGPSTPKTASGDDDSSSVHHAATELSTLLMSLRKLREAILATSATTPVRFAQQIYIFSIRFSILARHPPSYFPSLRHLLDRLHSAAHPLSASELTEFYSYLILDYACRQNEMATAYELLVHARRHHRFENVAVEQILAALTHDNWVAFWRTHKSVDGYMRAVINWATDHVTRQALKAIGRTYLSVNEKWLVGTCTGDEEDRWTWEEFAEKQQLGWQKNGDSVIIRKMRPKTAS